MLLIRNGARGFLEKPSTGVRSVGDHHPGAFEGGWGRLKVLEDVKLKL